MGERTKLLVSDDGIEWREVVGITELDLMDHEIADPDLISYQPLIAPRLASGCNHPRVALQQGDMKLVMRITRCRDCGANVVLHFDANGEYELDTPDNETASVRKPT